MTGSGSIPLTGLEVTHLLLAVADAWGNTRCKSDECDACVRTRDLWWDLWSRLNEDEREAMAIASMLADILYPPSPPFGTIL